MSPLYRISILQCQRALCDQFILLLKDSLSTKLNNFLTGSTYSMLYKNIKESMYELPNHAQSTYCSVFTVCYPSPCHNKFVIYGANCLRTNLLLAQVPGSMHSHEAGFRIRIRIRIRIGSVFNRTIGSGSVI